MRSINTTLASALPVLSLLVVGAGLLGQVDAARVRHRPAGRHAHRGVLVDLRRRAAARLAEGPVARVRRAGRGRRRPPGRRGPACGRDRRSWRRPADLRSPPPCCGRRGRRPDAEAVAAAPTVASAPAGPPADPPAAAAQEEAPLIADRYPRYMTGDATSTPTTRVAASVDGPGAEPAWLRSLVRDIADYPRARRHVPRHHAAARRRRRVPPGGRRARRPLLRRRRRPRRRHRGPRLHPRRARRLPPRGRRSCRSARPASCRGRWCARSTSSSTAPTSWRSTATPSTPASGSWSSTTCSPPAARRRPRPGWSRSSAASIVGLGFLIELAALGGRAALGDRRVEGLARY